MSRLLSDEYRRLWLDAVLLPGETDPVESCLKELAEYTGVSRAEVHRRCLRAVDDQRDLWLAKERSSPEQVSDFYNECDAYVYELLWWHALQQGDAPAWNARMVDLAAEHGARRYLDFGGGIGTNAILMARRGLDVTVADISEVLLACARWRLERRGLQACFVDLKKERPEARSFDLISAVDVLEHVYDPIETLAELHSFLDTSGLLVVDLIASKEDRGRPFHLLRSKYPIRSSIRGLGFRFVEGYQKFLVYRRVERTRARNLAIRGWDRVRWRLYYLAQGKWPRARPGPAALG